MPGFMAATSSVLRAQFGLPPTVCDNPGFKSFIQTFSYKIKGLLKNSKKADILKAPLPFWENEVSLVLIGYEPPFKSKSTQTRRLWLPSGTQNAKVLLTNKVDTLKDM